MERIKENTEEGEACNGRGCKTHALQKMCSVLNTIHTLHKHHTGDVVEVAQWH